MQFHVLGPLEARTDAGFVTIARMRERSLLSLLLINANTPLADETIIDALWGDESPRNPRAALQTAVSRLRSALADPSAPPVLQRRGNGYLISVDPDGIDSHRFEKLVAAAEAHNDHRAAVALLDEALALWRGSAHADVRYEEFAQPQIRNLEERHIDARELRIDYRMKLGEHRSVVADLEALVHQFPLRESLWSKLMLALYRCERQAEALRVYQRARTAIAEATGLEPGRELARLEEAILVDNVDPEVSAEPLVSSDPVKPPGNLPTALTSFVGRQHELDKLSDLCMKHRLVSLVGPGGVGKTRLAIQVGEDLGTVFPGGIYLLSLDMVDSEDRLLDIAIAAISTAERPISGAKQLIEALRGRRTLIVLDNCEHVRRRAAEFAKWMIDETQNVSVLATSRQRLGVGGEVVWQVRPLPISGTESAAEEPLDSEPALDLFLDRMHTVRPDLPVEDSEIRAAARKITRVLDGLPLAIELTASRCFTLSPQAIAAEFDTHLDLPPSRDPLVADRHQTLDAALAWSLRLLSERQRRHFTSLAVVRESFGPDAVTALCDAPTEQDAMEVLADLVERSLIERVESTPPGPRFRFLRPIRAAARAILSREGRLFKLEQRYSLWLAERADYWYKHMNDRHNEVRSQVLAERWNLIAAIDWALANDPETALRLLAGPRYLWVPLGLRWAAIANIQSALAAAPERTAIRVNALNTLVLLTRISRTTTAVTRIANRGDFPTLSEEPGSPRPHNLPLPDAQAAAAEAAEIAEEIEDPALIAFSEFRKGFALEAEQRDDDAARIVLAAVLALEATTTPWETSSAVHALARIHLNRGDFTVAEGLAEEVMQIRIAAKHTSAHLAMLDELGRITRAQGRYTDALAHYQQALSLTESWNVSPSISAFLHTEYAYLAMELGDSALASHHLGMGLSAARATAHRRLVGAVRLAQAQLAIGDLQYDSAHDYLDEALSIFEEKNDTIALAYTLSMWGLLQLLRADRLGAHELLVKSVQSQHAQADPIALARAYEGLATMAADRHDFETAAVLFGAAETERDNGRCPEGHWQGLLDCSVAEIDTKENASALARGRAMSRRQAMQLAAGPRQ